MADRKVAVVTGARRGIGRGIAIALAEAGFDIVVNDLARDSDAETTLDMLAERRVQASFIAADIADLTSHARLVGAAYDQFGRMDCLINNAGVMCVRGDMLE